MKLREIAKHLREVANDYPEQGVKVDSQVVYQNGGFKIKCQPYSSSIRNVAKKYENPPSWVKGVRQPRYDRISASNKRAAFDNFVKDRELENALNLALAVDIPVYWGAVHNDELTPLISASTQGLPDGFVCGKVTTTSDYNVTHLRSGLTASCQGRTKSESLKKFNESKDKIETAVLRQEATGYDHQAVTWGKVKEKYNL